jgi:hypothetical protein
VHLFIEPRVRTVLKKPFRKLLARHFDIVLLNFINAKFAKANFIITINNHLVAPSTNRYSICMYDVLMVQPTGSRKFNKSDIRIIAVFVYSKESIKYTKNFMAGRTSLS